MASNCFAEKSMGSRSALLVPSGDRALVLRLKTMEGALEEAIQQFGYHSLRDLASISSRDGSVSRCQHCRSYEGMLQALANVLLIGLQTLEDGQPADTKGGSGSYFLEDGPLGSLEGVSCTSLHSETANLIASDQSTSFIATVCSRQSRSIGSFNSMSYSDVGSAFSGNPRCSSTSWFRGFFPSLSPELDKGDSRQARTTMRSTSDSAPGLCKNSQRRKTSNSSDTVAAAAAARCSTVTAYLRRGGSYTLSTVPTLEGMPHIKETDQTVISRMDGRRMINDYILLRRLGRGSYGQVVLVQHRETKEKYAMKIMHLGKKLYEKGVKAIRSEIAVMKMVTHPHLVRLYEVIGDKYRKTVFLIMQYISGGSIARKLSPTTIEPVPERTLRHCAAQILSSLKHLHSNRVFHRDIKPDNILVDEKGDAFLADFGVSAICTGAAVCGVAGTPAFMAPEVCSGKLQVVGELVDVWALGVSLYQLMYGILPFYAATYFDMMRNIVNNAVTFPDEEREDSCSSHVPIKAQRFKNFSRDMPFHGGLGKKEESSHSTDVYNTDDDDDDDDDDVSNSERSIKSSAAFKELIRGMLCKDPEQRWTLRRIGESAWLNGGVLRSKRELWHMLQMRNGTESPVVLSPPTHRPKDWSGDKLPLLQKTNRGARETNAVSFQDPPLPELSEMDGGVNAPPVLQNTVKCGNTPPYRRSLWEKIFPSKGAKTRKSSKRSTASDVTGGVNDDEELALNPLKRHGQLQ